MGASLEIRPARTLQTEQVSIVARGFVPGALVTLTSTLTDDAGVRWRAAGTFVADELGVIDVSSAPSEGGTFEGIDPSGLFWSLQPPSGEDRGFLKQGLDSAHMLGTPAIDPLKPLTYDVVAMLGDDETARTSVVLDRVGPDVEVSPLRDGRLRGVTYRQRGSSSRGAIMCLTGSGGGVETLFAPLLASQGYDVLSLAYFAYDDLPMGISAIPLEYFGEGFEWMKREFNASKIALQGYSRGGEAALTIAAYLPEQVAGTVAIVPMFATSQGWDLATGAAGPSWTLEGNAIPYAPLTSISSIEHMQQAADSCRDGFAAVSGYRQDLDRPEVRQSASIPVERMKGPLLLISGMDDQIWPSSWGCGLVVNRLRAKGFRYPYRHLALPDTGHVIPAPNQVTTFTAAMYHGLISTLLACGGSPRGSASASRVAWQAMLDHYEQIFAD